MLESFEIPALGFQLGCSFLGFKKALRRDYKWGYKSPNMGYNYSYPTYVRFCALEFLRLSQGRGFRGSGFEVYGLPRSRVQVQV